MQGAGRTRVGLVNDRPAGRAQRDDRDREDPQVLSLDTDIQVVEEAHHLFSETRRLGIECSDGDSEGPVLALQRIDLVEELACRAQGAKDPAFLALHVTLEVGDQVGQPRHGHQRAPAAQLLPDVVGLVDGGAVLVHQLRDRGTPRQPQYSHLPNTVREHLDTLVRAG